MDAARHRAFWATITSSGQQFTASSWTDGLSTPAADQRQVETFSSIADAAQHVHDLAQAKRCEAIFWHPGSAWMAGEIEKVR